MAATNRNGLRQRIWRGYKIGVSQRDTFVLGGSALLLVQLWGVFALGGRDRTRSNAAAGSRGSIFGLGPGSRGGSEPEIRRVNPRTPRGTTGWIGDNSTDLTPTPAYNRRSRRLAAYTPVRITGLTPDGQYVRVETIVGGRGMTGFVLHSSLQLNDPLEGMVPEQRQVTVTRPGGADLRDGPSFDANVISHADIGKTLVIAGRIRRPDFMEGVSGDFLLVRGTSRPLWIAAANTSDGRRR